MKVGIRGVDTDLATAIRTVVVLFLAWGIAVWRGGAGTMHTLTATNWTFLVVSGVATGLSWVCYFRALQLGTVSQVAPVDKLSVAIAIVLGAVFLRQQLTPQILLGAGLIVAGTLVLVL